MKRFFSIAAAAVIFAAVCFYVYTARQIKVCDHDFNIDAEKISLRGDEIDNVDSLIEELRGFKNLKEADLGMFLVSTDEANKLSEELPDTDIRCKTYVSLYGAQILTDSEKINLSGYEIPSTEELKKALPLFTNLKHVTLGDRSVSEETKNYFIETYPDVEFDLIATHKIFGRTVRDDTVYVDFQNSEIDGPIAEKLKILPKLEAVDLHGKNISKDEQLELVKDFPNVFFGWEVELGGKYFDSAAEYIDLSKTYGITTDEVRRTMPLFPKLKYLDMSDCGIDNEEMAKLRAEFPDTEIAWRLYLGRWSLKTDDVAFSVLIYDYSHKRLTSEDIQVLKYCTKLQALDLGHQAITDLSVIGDCLPELRVLILADNAISDLTPLSKLKHLHYLEFFVNQVTDLTPLAECHEMVDLNISYNHRISDISPLLNYPLLERLWLESTSVSEEDAQLLRTTYPNATVINHGDGSVDQGWRGHERYFAMIDMYHQHNYISDLFTMYDQ